MIRECYCDKKQLANCELNLNFVISNWTLNEIFDWIDNKNECVGGLFMFYGLIGRISLFQYLYARESRM